MTCKNMAQILIMYYDFNGDNKKDEFEHDFSSSHNNKNISFILSIFYY
jgi:hypothetical protein